MFNKSFSKTMRRVQEILSNDVDAVSQDSSSASSAIALKEKRLTFTWLDGEAQNVSGFPCLSCILVCFFLV